ncbi:MAG: hypothetical protein NTY19_24250 [Planctomycetota bacterium]|nr:hypothetical protein [Planctomycetota bacterium]
MTAAIPMLPFIYIAVAAMVVALLTGRSYLLLRPSVWFVVCMLVHLNFAAAFVESPFDGDLEDNGLFRLLAVLFPIGVLGWVVVTPKLSQTARVILQMCHATQPAPQGTSRYERRFKLLIAAISGVILVSYVLQVPVQSLGLTAVLTGSAGAAMAREESLKLLDNAFLRYGYLLHMGVFGPFLAGTVALWRSHTLASKSVQAILLVLIVVSVSLTGARSPAGFLLLSLALLHLLRRGFCQGGVALMLAATVGLMIASAMSLLREGRLDELTVEKVAETTVGPITDRVFVMPFETGLFTVLYSQERGLLGVSSIRPLALLLGYEYEHLANKVALEYYLGALESGSANTCFLFDLQASFGLLGGWLIALVLLCVLDFALNLLRRVSPGIVPVFTTVLLVCAYGLISCAYTTSLISHGLLPTVALAWCFVRWAPAGTGGAVAADARTRSVFRGVGSRPRAATIPSRLTLEGPT